MNGASHRIRLPGVGLGDRLVAIASWSVALLVVAVFLWLFSDALWHGWSKINWTFLTSVPLAAGRDGGILPMIVSTLMVLMVALVFAVPLAVTTSVLLAEFTRRQNWYARSVRISLDIVAAVPSIVFGLFGNALFCNWMGLGYSILAGGLTLACMILPILIRTLETGFRLVPDHFRQASAALGLSKSRMVVAILLPQAMPILVVGLVLAIGRVLAETAALLFTSGYVMRMPGTLLDSGRTLSIHIYDLSMNVPGGDTHAYATTLVLVFILLVVNSIAIQIADRWVRHATGGRIGR